MLDKEACFTRSERIIVQEAGDAANLIDPYRRVSVRLNPTAFAIWRLLDGGHSVGRVIEILKNEFETDGKKLEKDVIGFLRSLLRREMIR